MIATLASVSALSEAALWTFIAAFLRIGAAVAVLPVMGNMMIPMRIRLISALTLAAVIGFALPPGTLPTAPLSPAAILSEVVSGVFFGLLLRLLAMALQIAGSMAAQATSLAQIFGGAAGADPQPALGFVLSLGGLAFATAMGIHLKVIAYLVSSYDLIAYGAVLDGAAFAQLGLERVAQTFALGFSLAAPFVVAATLYNVTIGVINRAMPQLMVAFVGAPAITAGGLILLALCAPLIIDRWHDVLVQTGFGRSP